MKWIDMECWNNNSRQKKSIGVEKTKITTVILERLEQLAVLFEKGRTWNGPWLMGSTFQGEENGQGKEWVTWRLECTRSKISAVETKWMRLTWGHKLSIWVAAIRTNFTPSSLLEMEQAKLATCIEEDWSEMMLGQRGNRLLCDFAPSLESATSMRILS